MKKSTQALVLIVLFGLWRLSFASDWQLSVAGGTGQANDPSETSSTSTTDMSIDGVVHIVANQYQSTDTDGARLYTEYFLAKNSITADVSGASPDYQTKIDALHLQIGGIYEWANSDIVRPYFALTLGASYYSPEFTSEETYFSGTAGLGTKIKLTDFLALRLEARALGTLLDASSTIFCDDEDDCSVGVDGKVWMQQHYTAGMTWSF